MNGHFLQVGDRFLDRYQVTAVLGAGGMSRVYGAVQDGLGRKVAIKLLSPVGAENLTQSQLDNVAARFEREAQLISQFKSSHTVTMYDFGRSNGCLYMILEYVEGRNLHELIQQAGPLPASRVVRIMRQTLASLAEAHQLGILHRDIKPQNIMVYEHLGDPDNTKVLDFGIAKAVGESERDQRKLTEERTIVGTPSYMSPEQILGNALTPASDLYSLGLVVYELLYGVVAVDADSVVSTMARQLTPTAVEIPERAGVPAELLNVLRKLVLKDASARYQSAAEVLADLDAMDGGDPSLTSVRITPVTPTLDGVGTTQQSARPLVFTGVLLSGSILLALAVIVGLVWMMMGKPSKDPAADPTPPTAAAVVEPEPDRTPAAVAAPAAATAAEVVAPADPPPVVVAPTEVVPPAEPTAAAQKTEVPAPSRDERTVARVARPKAEVAEEAPAEETPPAEPTPEDPPVAEPLVEELIAPPPAVAAATEAPAVGSALAQPAVTASSAASSSTNSKTAPEEKDEDEDAKPAPKTKKKKKETAPPLSF